MRPLRIDLLFLIVHFVIMIAYAATTVVDVVVVILATVCCLIRKLYSLVCGNMW